MVALSFWCSASNTMVLLLGLFGPTVLDMTVILGTSPTGLSVNISLAGYKFDSDLKTVFEECVVEVLTKGDQRPWEVYNPNFLAYQLGCLQRCPFPFLSSRFLLSQERFFGSSEKECKTVEKEFANRHTKFLIRLRNLKSWCADTFAKWWEAYTKDFFHTPAEEILKKLFDGHPKNGAEVVVMAVAKKKLALPPKRVAAVVPTPPSKHPCPEAKTAGDASQKTTRATALSVSLPLLVIEASVAIQLDPTIELAVNLIVERLVTSASVAAHIEAGPMLDKRPRSVEKTTLNLQLVVEAASRVELPSPLWEVELDALLASSSRTAGLSVPTLGLAEINAIAKLQELLSFSAS
ncbi:hypothetical protein D8674_024934 [Pyrus ussuriensis x Pyrus communis]|uniref:Uncharacterized protein n=1 Tax=Pyrus ussuriensis x Pyrus communis TaxID=2448454 RepID=A0A5N5H9F4_9ROSA|nr:hypothetical protein D8674_024934 [Pyrus ussuriensis x Pyrus communis]